MPSVSHNLFSIVTSQITGHCKFQDIRYSKPSKRTQNTAKIMTYDLIGPLSHLNFKIQIPEF